MSRNGFASKTRTFAQTKDRVCGRKIKYPSIAAGDSAIRKLKPLTPMHSYECPHCAKFHIGHRATAEAAE